MGNGERGETDTSYGKNVQRCGGHVWLKSTDVPPPYRHKLSTEKELKGKMKKFWRYFQGVTIKIKN